ncbi:4-diphosphocytidyl-2-C-methyl-D-erythritol kinase [bacterium HR15]|nr:4-diphosphocytidyl-2-C-methyl-D-erythritol kinase [bacterium HR15]
MIQLTAPAKMNLTLEVLGRREDGYHTIASLMHRLSLHDTLVLTPIPTRAGQIHIEVEGFPVPTDERNLVWRALKWVGATAQSGWHVRLIKHIPPQAGLGGGSSDAAAILKHFSPSLEIALQLGSDVPFFLNGCCARVEGRGEQVKPLPSMPPFWWVLAKPQAVSVSTAWAYAQLNRPHGRTCPSYRTSATDVIEKALLQGTIRTPEELAPLLHNDFEAVVLPMYEPLQRLRTRMERLGALRVLLCGSGAAQAALCLSQTEAEQMAATLRCEGYWAEAVHLER